MKLAIIGSAGRHGDSKYVTEEVYDKMLELTKEFIKELDDEIILVSGGAAFSDHLAITTYLSNTISKEELVNGIELHLPAMWNNRLGEYRTSSAGNTSNYYHRKFSTKVFGDIYNSLEDIDTLVKSEKFHIDIFYYDGFKLRNIQVGKVDAILAFTNSNTGNPKPGGTSHTWCNSSATIRRHYDIKKIYEEVS